MAWTSKSDRFNGSSVATAAAHIGPGHYKNELSRTTEHGYAPFGSTDPKSAASQDARSGNISQSPPPGAYDPKLPGKYDPGLPKKHVPFGASATRIDLRSGAKKPLDSRPGPGQYCVNPGLEPAQASRTMGVLPDFGPILRSSSAPSIPQSHQSYGYEEVGGGRLVRQGPKLGELFCSGRPGDSAGPGQYEPNDEANKPRQKNGAFLKGAARTVDRNVEGPGPGHYVAKSSLEVTSNGFNLGSSFASQSERGHSKLEVKRLKASPGPCSYTQDRNAAPDLRELRAELQYFGSTVERFKQGPGERGCVPDTLGPGKYANINRKAVPPNAKGFCNTQERFKADGLAAAPGPGAYESSGLSDTDKMSGPMATFSMLGNSGGLAFGAMSKRLSYPDDDPLGPGAYRIPGMSDDVVVEDRPEDFNSKGAPRRRRASTLPGSAFASKTPKDFSVRCLIREGGTRPPPGAYDPVLVKDQGTVVRLRSKSEGFLSGGGDRFFGGPLATKKDGGDVGPGRYSPQMVTGGKRLNTFNRSICEGMPDGGRPKGLGFETQDRRFKLSASAKSPGPGSYITDPGWIKKSHNCYFGDLT